MRQFFLCLAILLVISPLASFAAPAKARAASGVGTTNSAAAAAPVVAPSSTNKKSAPKKKKCDDLRDGPCVCDDTVSPRKSSIGTTCDKVAKAFIFVDPADVKSSKTGDIKFITGSAVATAKADRSVKGSPLNCDQCVRGYYTLFDPANIASKSIVELQFVKEEIDKIKKTDSARHTVMCNQIQGSDFQAKFFDVINSADNVVFAEAKVNNAKLIPVGGKKPKTVTAQAARGAVLYITQLLKPGAGEPTSNTIATKIETAMTNLMTGTGQNGFDAGFTARWEKRLADSIVDLKAAPKLVALQSAATSSASSGTNTATTTTNCNGKRPAPPTTASGPPGKKQKPRALLEFVENLARRAIGKPKPKASTQVTAGSCLLPGASSAKTTSKASAKVKPTSKSTAKPVTKTSPPATAKTSTKGSSKTAAGKVAVKPKVKTAAATKPTSKATAKAKPAKPTKSAGKKASTVKPTTKVTSKPKVKTTPFAKPATKATIKAKPAAKVAKLAPKKTAKVAPKKKVSAKPKPTVVKPKSKVVKTKVKGKKL